MKFHNVTYDLADEFSRVAINNLEGQLEATRVDLNNMRAAVGSPLTAATTSAMTNTNKIYVYTGTTTTVSGVTFTAGNWYYHDGTKWQLGGIYNETALETDTTLTVSGAAADAKVTGDNISDLKSALDQNYDLANIGDYINGSYTNAGVLTSGNTTRVRFNRFILLHAGDSIRANVPTGLQITISSFNATTKALIKEGWIDTNPYTANEDVLVLPVWKKANNTAITPTEIGTVYINRGIESIVNSINKSTSEEYVFSEYVNGSFQNTGQLTLRNDRIRFGSRIFLRTGDAVHFSAFTGQWHGYSTWEKDPTADYGYTLIKDYTLNGVIADEETISFDEDCYFMAVYGETGSTDFPIANLGIITTITRRLTYEHAYKQIETLTDPRKTYDFKGFTMGGNIVAHRGEPYAENTMLALKKCIANGTNVLEIDLAFTSDNIPVLLHDTTINRTGRNADGTTIAQTINIADITYQQALQYDFGIWKGAEYAGQKIPTLKEALLLFKRKNCCGIVDLTGHSYTREQYDIMHDIFIGTGMTRNVALNASTTQLGVYTAKYNDTPLNPSGSTNNIRTVKSLVNNYRNLCPLIIVSGFKNLAEDLTYNFFSQVHELEAIALIGFLETQSDITALFDAGCDMVYSDTITPNEYD